MGDGGETQYVSGALRVSVWVCNGPPRQQEWQFKGGRDLYSLR